MIEVNRKKTGVNVHILFAVLVIFFFYSDIPSYLYVAEILPIPTFYFIALALGGLLFLAPIGSTYSNKGKIELFVASPVKFWLFFYLFLTGLWLIPSTQSAAALYTIGAKIRSVVFLSVVLFILSGDEVIQKLARRVLLACVILAVFNNVFEMLNPLSFLPVDHEFANPGRSAGMYINANLSGAAIILGAIFGIGILPDRYKTAFVLLCTLGLMTTFSRSSLISWCVICFIFSRQRLLSLKSLATASLVAVVFTVFSFTFVMNYMEDQTGVNVSNVLERTEWFSSPFETQDDSSSERKLVAKRAWELFTEHPLLGNGLGSTRAWDEEASTHNMYLFFMADHGFIGAFILPLLIAASVWKARGEARRIAVPFVFFVLFSGFFSHNILDNHVFLISFALMSAISVQSRSYEQ